MEDPESDWRVDISLPKLLEQAELADRSESSTPPSIISNVERGVLAGGRREQRKAFDSVFFEASSLLACCAGIDASSIDLFDEAGDEGCDARSWLAFESDAFPLLFE